VSGSDVGGVVAIVDVEIEAEAGGLAAGIDNGHALEGGHLDFRAMDGEVHGGDGGQHGNDDERHEQGRDAEEVDDGTTVHSGG